MAGLALRSPMGLSIIYHNFQYKIHKYILGLAVGVAPTEAFRLSILSHIHGAGDGVDYDGSGGLGGDEKHRLVFYVLPQELDQLPDNLVQYQVFYR